MLGGACAAAIGPARQGAKTLLVEATGVLGGMGTSGLVPAWCPLTDGVRFIYGDLATGVFERCKAGMRHLPADRMVQGSTRVMPVCLAMGEAAGTAAAIAATMDAGDVHAVDSDALRRRLKDYGAYLPEAGNTQHPSAPPDHYAAAVP